MESGLVNEIREPLFDTFTAAAAAVLPSTINMFVKGQSDTKGPELTNMTADGELPSPERMKVYGVRVAFFNTADADILAMVMGYAVCLKVSGRPQFTAPLEFCAAGSGLSGKTQNGLNDPRATVTFPDEYLVDITAGQRFALQLIAKGGVTLGAGTGLFLRATLDGLHSIAI